MSKLQEKSVNKGPDLSDLNNPGRGHGLADLIPPAADGPPPADPLTGGGRSPDLPEPDAATPDETAETATDPGSKGRPRSPGKDLAAVYVSENVRKRFDKYRHDQRLTNAQVVLRAVSSLHSELAEVIAAARYSTAPVDPLFPADPAAVKYLGGGPAQIMYAATPEQGAVLDRLGAEHGFSARSTWLAPVLNHFLPGRKDKRAA
ncbi:hypothetical protein [Mycobacteroides abscessus]|uniref:hypothetical protein n=1 Tax=Mycobacteroides abscessus TaxID=36809 RepID=UPI0009A56F2D|nr:hypothetical protein [Mycobacteroides abscessus]SKK25579.1 Uncharacterised protein [Mycobacteroides abscessus subsp. massiliense]SKK29732.1 Uncharacterised protein [Mycobacteroides abscessus subsp. massiliense]SKK50972.1 Uncharacterised protein [Mycobacteroides abscessus subsp. massiliense]